MPDYLSYVRDPANGYLSITFPNPTAWKSPFAPRPGQAPAGSMVPCTALLGCVCPRPRLAGCVRHEPRSARAPGGVRVPPAPF